MTGFLWRLLLCVAAGHGLLWWLARAPEDRRLRHVVLASFWLRVGLGVTLYTISIRQWPILRSLQVQDGFWAFALDARLYHTWGIAIADAWAKGIELPDPGARYDYLALLAAIYQLLGAHPLYAVLVHAWFGAMTGWFAYRIGQRLFDRTTALRAACFVGFWPSSVLWSSQILRDTLTWSLVLAVLWLVILAVSPDDRLEPRRGLARWWRLGVHAASLAAATMLATRLREYLGSVLTLVVFVTLVPVAVAGLIRRRVSRTVWRSLWLMTRSVYRVAARCARAISPYVGQAIRLSGVAAVVMTAVVVARGADTAPLFSPAHPEHGHVRLGLQHQQRGELALAEAEFRRAIDLRPDNQEVYLLWAGMLSAAHRPQEAQRVCASWSGPDANGAMSRCVDQLKVFLEPVQTPPARQPITPDTIAPTVPADLQAYVFSGTQVVLSWSASTDNVAVAGYHVLRDDASIGMTPGLSYQDTRLSSNTPYAYAVLAVDAAGNVSAPTPAVTATTLAPAPPSTPLPLGLFAYWPMDGRPGHVVTEATNQHPNGRLQNGPTWIRDSLGTFLVLDGVDDYVDAGPIPALTASFTVAAWLYRRQDLPNQEPSMWCSQGLDGQDGWAAYVQQSGEQVVHGFLKGGVALVGSSVPNARDAWEHVAWVVDADAQPSLYVNGILMSQGKHALPIRPPAPGTATYLGANQAPRATPGRFFPGAIDEVRLYRQPLRAAAIADLAQAVVPAARLPRLASRRRAKSRTPAPDVRAEQPRKPDAKAVPPSGDVARIVDPAPQAPSAWRPRDSQAPVIPNTSPIVEAGPAVTLQRPQAVVLKGEVIDDGRPADTLTYRWTQKLGPPARFTTPNAIETRVQLPESGRYQFRLTASDGALTAEDDVAITVVPFTASGLAAHLSSQGRAVMSEMNPQWLGSIRNSVVASGGSSLMDMQSAISRPLEMITYLPRAILVGFLAPFPSQWFDASGLGGTRFFAGAEMAFVYLLLLGIVLRTWRTTRCFGWRGCARRMIPRLRLGRVFLLVFGLVLGTAASLVMANLGTLFRIRLLYWLPLLILVAAGDPLGNFAWASRRLVHRYARWMDRRPGRPGPAGERPAPEPVSAGARVSD